MVTEHHQQPLAGAPLATAGPVGAFATLWAVAEDFNALTSTDFEALHFKEALPIIPALEKPQKLGKMMEEPWPPKEHPCQPDPPGT